MCQYAKFFEFCEENKIEPSFEKRCIWDHACDYARKHVADFIDRYGGDEYGVAELIRKNDMD